MALYGQVNLAGTGIQPGVNRGAIIAWNGNTPHTSTGALFNARPYDAGNRTYGRRPGDLYNGYLASPATNAGSLGTGRYIPPNVLQIGPNGLFEPESGPWKGYQSAANSGVPTIAEQAGKSMAWLQEFANKTNAFMNNVPYSYNRGAEAPARALNYPTGPALGDYSMAAQSRLPTDYVPYYNPSAYQTAGGYAGAGQFNFNPNGMGYNQQGGPGTYTYQPPGITLADINGGYMPSPNDANYKRMFPAPVTVYGSQVASRLGGASVAAQGYGGGAADGGAAGGILGAGVGGGGSIQDILGQYIAAQNASRQSDLGYQEQAFRAASGGSISDAVRRGMAGLYSTAPTFQTGRAGTVPAAMLDRVQRSNDQSVQAINSGYDSRNAQFAQQVAGLQLQLQQQQISQDQFNQQLAETRRQFDSTNALRQQQLQLSSRPSVSYGGGGGGSSGGGGGGGSSSGNNPFSAALQGRGVRDQPFSSIGYDSGLGGGYGGQYNPYGYGGGQFGLGNNSIIYPSGSGLVNPDFVGAQPDYLSALTGSDFFYG